MKKQRKILSMILSFVMIFSSLPFTALGEETGATGKSTTVSVTKYVYEEDFEKATVGQIMEVAKLGDHAKVDFNGPFQHEVEIYFKESNGGITGDETTGSISIENGNYLKMSDPDSATGEGNGKKTSFRHTVLFDPVDAETMVTEFKMQFGSTTSSANIVTLSNDSGEKLNLRSTNSNLILSHGANPILVEGSDLTNWNTVQIVTSTDNKLVILVNGEVKYSGANPVAGFNHPNQILFATPEGGTLDLSVDDIKIGVAEIIEEDAGSGSGEIPGEIEPGDTEPEIPSMISISSNWQGSVFGSVGGADKITFDNFEITEKEDGIVTVRSSNNRGKIATGDTTEEGIAYYFKEISNNDNFEFRATAKIEALDNANNQVSFGLMIRDHILENENLSGYTNNYVAVGPIDMKNATEPDKEICKVYYKADDRITKHPIHEKQAPIVGDSIDLSIRKSGSFYILQYGNEDEVTIDTSKLGLFTEDKLYVGLFTSRKATISYSNIELNIEGEVDTGDWTFSAFGSNTSAGRNPDPIMNPDGSITMKATGGKVAKDLGISFFYKNLPANTNFEITTVATVGNFNSDSGISTPNQKSFGLMLLDQLGSGSTAPPAKYLGIGALDTDMKAFYKDKGDTSTDPIKLDKLNVNKPGVGEVYNLSIKKSGNTYVLTCNGESEIITVEDLFTDNLFAGFYVARDAEITFSDFDIKIETKKVTKLDIDATQMKIDYLLHEELDLTGIEVTAFYNDNTSAKLSLSDLIVTGFNSSEVGTNTITIHYGGQSVTVDLTISPLACTALDIKYLPAKTEYYLGDHFDPRGFAVIATYNNGYHVEEITEEKYTFLLNGEEITEDFTFAKAGQQTMMVQSVETPETTTSFTVDVKAATLTALEIRKSPTKTLYFIGEDFEPTGMTVYAKYSDSTEVRLMADEYSITDLDSTTAGAKVVTIEHKGKTVDLPIKVKVKEVIGIELSKYPRTTYEVGEDLDLSNLEVSKVYDNGDREVLAKDQYTIDKSAYTGTLGTYEIRITPTNTSIASIAFPVVVREKTEIEWKSIVFGQSISVKADSLRNFSETKEDGTVRLVALEGGGKVTGDHDGITFYYTELDAATDNFVLSADIKVEAYAKTPHDGQESFGIMARDAIGTHGDSSVFASNIAAIGGFSGGTREENGTQLFVRAGVESSDGAGSQGIKKIMLKNERPTSSNTYPTKDYKLTLAKTNSGFTGKINDGKEEILYYPDILNVQDGKMYVGFYVARLATIEVSNIELTVTAAETDAPKVEPPVQPKDPSFGFVSLPTSSKKDYNLMVQSNVNGVITIKQGNQIIVLDKPMVGGEILTIPTIIESQAKTNFSATFLPDDTEILTSYDKMVENFTVEMKTIGSKETIYVSPTGKSTNQGTTDSPLDLDTAITFVQEGQKIILLEGTYNRSTPLNIRKYNDGTATAKKYLWAEEGAKVVIDFNKKSEGGLLSGNYWHIKGIDFANSAGNTKGFTIGGNHNIIELCNFYNNGDTGLQISRTDGSANTIDQWPSYNLILNCTSYNNSDPSQNNADGFAAKLTSGVGNVFDGCIAHNNVDDGWDLYTKAGAGAIGAVWIKNSITYGNGRLTDGEDTSGDGNGFKLGGEGIHVPHIIENSLAFDNEAYGFTSNSNPGLIAINNYAFNNVKGNADFRTYVNIQEDFTIDRFISYQNQYKAKDVYPSVLQSNKNFMFDGTASKNLAGVALTDEDFISLISNIPFERDSKGNIIWGDFLKPKNSEIGQVQE